MNKGYFLHERAWVESDNIGKNTRIWAFTHIMKNVKIGNNCNIGEHCFIENGVIIGDDVTVKNGISLWDGIIIENKVFLGPNSVFTNDIRPRSKSYNYTISKTIIKEGASIGANATVIGGIELGQYCMIGAGSVVTKNVPDFALIYGNPAKIKGYACECGKRLQFTNDVAVCECGKKYEKKKKIIIRK